MLNMSPDLRVREPSTGLGNRLVTATWINVSLATHCRPDHLTPAP